jgi:hypothetical protein
MIIGSNIRGVLDAYHPKVVRKNNRVVKSDRPGFVAFSRND